MRRIFVHDERASAHRDHPDDPKVVAVLRVLCVLCGKIALQEQLNHREHREKSFVAAGTLKR
jgi:hypothetical protein